MSDLDCRTCGACCVGDMDDGEGFASVSVKDVLRMSRHAASRLYRRYVGGEAYLSTPPVYSEEFGKACAFLRGTPGHRVSCGIYDSRPDVCRAFAPGSKECRWSREQIGLET